MSLVTLHCVNGNHNWERQSQRGRKPMNCSAHMENIPVTLSSDEVADESEEEFILDQKISLVAAVTGADRAARLFENMKMLNSKTNRQVIMR